MANYTKQYNIPTNPVAIKPNDEAKLIAKVGVDLADLITQFNTNDTARTTVKVPIPLSTFKEMDANGDLAGTTGAKATATLNLTTDIVLSSADYFGKLNGLDVTTQVLAAAANPTDTVLIGVTLVDNDATITITPNDGTNNGATPVGLTTAQLVLAINGNTSAAYDGINCTITDTSSVLPLFTATGGDATALADSGEGDGVSCSFWGGYPSQAGILSEVSTPSFGSVATGGTDEMSAITWVASNVDKIGAQVSMPYGFSGASDVTLCLRAKSGGDTDTPTIGVQTNWDNDDTPVADTSSAVNTDTADWAVETATIAAADVPDTAGTCTVILTPGAHTTDTLQLAEAYFLVTIA